MKKIPKIFFISLIFNLILIINVFASEDINLTVEEVTKNAQLLNCDEYEYVEIEEVTYINPLYKDIITEDDLNKSSNIMLFSSSEDCRTIKTAAEELKAGFKNRVETIPVSYITDSQLDRNVYYDIFNEAMEHTGVPTEGDYMQWQFAGWQAKATGNIYQGKYYYTITFTLTYYTNIEQEKEMDIAVSNLLNELNLQGTDYEKIVDIYDYLCINVQYDYSQTEDTLKHTAYAALINKKAVCQGYAILFYRLALENNIDARLISGLGNGGPHGWNIVKIGNYYYNLDSTWDAGYTNIGYNYFLVTDSNFSRHIRDTQYSTNEFYNKYPMGSQNYTAEMNEFDKNQATFTGLLKQNGYYWYYENGKINYKFTGLYEQDGEKWYVVSGKVDLKYAGTCKVGETIYLIENGKVAKNITKVMLINNEWRMVENGKVQYSYDGIGSNENGTWYVRNGLVDFKYTGTYRDKNGVTYVVEKNRIMTNYNKVMQIDGVWRNVEKGIVFFLYTGLGKNENGTWYLENGEVTFKYTGTYVEANKALIIEGSKVVATVPEHITEVMLINNKWRMVKDGKVDYNYTGIGTNANGTWYLENGEVTFKYTGSYTDEKGATYIIENSKVMTNVTKVVLVDDVWRMVIKGMVKYNYNAIGSNENGKWYVQNGEVTFNFTGTYVEANTAFIVENSKVMAIIPEHKTEVMLINNKWRMVKDGKVDYNYTGIGTNANGTWYLENGEVTFKYTGYYTHSDGKTYKVINSKIVN